MSAASEIPAAVAAEALSASLGELTSRIVGLGESSEATADQAGGAFERIGDTAKEQLGAIAVGAVDAFSDATLNAMKTGEFSGKSLEKAMKATLANSLKTIGQEATVEAAFSFAKGAAMLASPVTAALAGPHFLAGAQLLGVAALAGAAAGALGSGGGSGGGGKGGAVEPSGADSDGSEGANITQAVTVIGNLDTAGAEHLSSQLTEAEKKRDLS